MKKRIEEVDSQNDITIESLLNEITDANCHGEVDTAEPVGDEVW